MKAPAPWVLALAFVGLSACTASAALHDQEEILILEVASDSVPCVGEMVGRCIQVRYPGTEHWRIFYDPIDGFQHEEGVQYTLEVGRRGVPDPPADGSAYAYRLIRILAREPVAGGVVAWPPSDVAISLRRCGLRSWDFASP